VLAHALTVVSRIDKLRTQIYKDAQSDTVFGTTLNNLWVLNL